jgi:FKBP-type peptidyl-prolyl cis-trans isomerase (trigger factor)
MHLQEPNEEAKKRAIEQLIDGYLLLNSAQKSDVNITEDDIEHELVEIKLKYDTENDFHQMLNSNQIDIDVIKNRIKSNLLIAKYIKNNFSVNTDIPLEKLQEIYRENLKSFKTQEMVKASHILIKGTGIV